MMGTGTWDRPTSWMGVDARGHAPGAKLQRMVATIALGWRWGHAGGNQQH